MLELPKVSIVLPTYNRANLIGRSIQSLLNQTYKDFEIIVVDDFSSDNTEEIVKKIDDPCIHYFRHKANLGAAAARNTGIKLSKGEFIAFQDSDDEWIKDKLEKQIYVFYSEYENIGVVYTKFCRIMDNKKIYIPSKFDKKREGYIEEQLLHGSFIGTPTILAKKACLEKIGGFDESLLALEDWELVIRLSKYYQFKFIDEPLVISYSTPISISSNKKLQLEAYEKIIEKHKLDMLENKELLSKHFFAIGNLLCQNKDLKPGRPYLLEAIKKQPFNFKYLFAGFLSLFGKNVYSKVAELKRKFF
jgi:glycosyltransferase involved in cell wall biosynthesis